jgi:hypothetical protein
MVIGWVLSARLLGFAGVAQWKPRPSGERAGTPSPLATLNYFPTICERQMPATYFSRFDVESYRPCGLVGLTAGRNRSEIAGGQTGANDRQFFTSVADGQEPDESNRKKPKRGLRLGTAP